MNPKIANIALIGYRGTGKSTVGRLLADSLAWEFVDTDELVERDARKTIAEIFAVEKETGFRNRETAQLKRIAPLPNRVIATGGGIVLRAENRAFLRQCGLVVRLCAEANVIWDRLARDPNTPTRRPNLSVGGIAEVDEMLKRRNPYYAECADLTCEEAELSPRATADRILAAWLDLTRTGSG